MASISYAPAGQSDWISLPLMKMGQPLSMLRSSKDELHQDLTGYPERYAT